MNIKPFGIEILQVKSNSMSPIFNKKDIIIIKEQEEYNEGDIVAYKTGDDEIITHRIIEKKESVFYTKGDHNNTKDETEIYYKDIKGKVIFIFYSIFNK